MNRIVTLTALACFASPALISRADTSDVDRLVIGPWQLRMTTPDDQPREPVVLIGRQYDDYVAWYVGDDGLEAMKDVQLEDDTLVGSITPKEHPEITVTLQARLKGDDACGGVGSYRSPDGDSGSWEFTGKRIALSDFDKVSQWQLEFVTPENEEHSATVTVVAKADDLYAWYSGKDHELPVLDIKIDGDKGVMKMSAATRDGGTVDLVFRGVAVGDEIKGDIEYNLGGETGSFPFTAKRKS